MQEFVMLIHDPDLATVTQEEIAASTEKVIAWFEEHTRAGRLVEGAGRRLQPPKTAKTVQIVDGRALVTDGPYAETKEQIGGFAILEVPDMAAAVELVKSWPVSGFKVELRPVFVTP